jgi:hypothetical protein
VDRISVKIERVLNYCFDTRTSGCKMTGMGFIVLTFTMVVSHDERQKILELVIIVFTI